MVSEKVQKKVSMAPDLQGSETVLLVEDEPAIRRVTARMLAKLGYNVLTANTPGRAIGMARKHRREIHLLLTDVVMPEMNGYDLAQNLVPLFPNLRILYMSGYTSEVIAHHGVLDKGVCFIQKPFVISDLARKVREALDERRTL
jgi:CheY-like chemotaxis protein